MRRRERGTSLSGLFASILQGQKKHKDGEIHIMPNGYRFGDDGWTNTSGAHFAARPTADGRMASLHPKRTAYNCPKPPGDFPIFADGSAWVSMTVCRKCQHHIPRKRGQPYPCCAVLREHRGSEPSPLQKLGECMQEASRGVREIMGVGGDPQ